MEDTTPNNTGTPTPRRVNDWQFQTALPQCPEARAVLREVARYCVELSDNINRETAEALFADGYEAALKNVAKMTSDLAEARFSEAVPEVLPSPENNGTSA